MNLVWEGQGFGDSSRGGTPTWTAGTPSGLPLAGIYGHAGGKTWRRPDSVLESERYSISCLGFVKRVGREGSCSMKGEVGGTIQTPKLWSPLPLVRYGTADFVFNNN